MAVLKSTRSAQWELSASFTFSIGDTMTNTAGAADEFASVASHIFDIIALPPRAVVTGGQVITGTAFVGPTAYNVTVGDLTTADRYLGTTDTVAAGLTALVPTGYVGIGENIRLTVTPTDAPATAGKFTVRIKYIIVGRANEVQIT